MISFTTRATPKKDALFDDEYVLRIPSEEEVRIVGIRLRNCQYYLTGFDVCRQKILKSGAVSFDPCKSTLNSYYSCMTQEQYGNKIDDVPAEGQENMKKFLTCTLQELEEVPYCQRYLQFQILNQIFQGCGLRFVIGSKYETKRYLNMINFMKEQLKLLCKDETFHRSKTATAFSTFTENSIPVFQQQMHIIDHSEQLQIQTYTQTFFIDKPKPVRESPKDNIIQSGLPYHLRQMEFYYFKVRTKGCKSPINCQISCDQDFQIMVSFTAICPTKFNCDRVIRNKLWTIKHNDEDFLYLSIISRKECDVKFYITYGQQEHKKIQKPQHQISFIQIEYPKTPQTIVLHNKQMVGRSPNKYIKDQERAEKYLKVLGIMNQRRRVVRSVQKEREFDYQVKELNHQKGIIQRLEEQRLNKQHVFETQWIFQIYYLQLLYFIDRRIQYKQQVIKRNRMAGFRLWLKLKRMKEKLYNTKGHSLEDRAIVDARMTLTVFTKTIKRKLLNQYIRTTIVVMKQRIEPYSIKTQLIKTFRAIQLIKTTFTEYLYKIKKYKMDMLNKWDVYLNKKYTTQIKMRPSDRDKRQVEWFKQLQDKPFAEMIKQNFLTFLIRERVRNHMKEQKLIQQIKQEREQLKKEIFKDPIDIVMQKELVAKLANDISALQFKNQFFIHCDIEPFMIYLMDKFLIFQDDPQIEQQKAQKSNRVSIKRRFERQSLQK